MKELKYNLTMLFSKKELYIAIIISNIISSIQIFFNFMELKKTWFFGQILEIGSEHFLGGSLSQMFGSGIFIFPIVFSLVYADSFYDSESYGVNKYLHTRFNQKIDYIWKWFISVFTSFVLMFSTYTINLMINCSLYGNTVNTDINGDYTYLFDWTITDQRWAAILHYQQPYKFAMLCILILTLIISLIIGLEFSVSFLLKKKMIIYISGIIFILVETLLVTLVFGNEYYSLINLLQFDFLANIPKNALFIIPTALLAIQLVLVYVRLSKKDSL